MGWASAMPTSMPMPMLVYFVLWCAQWEDKAAGHNIRDAVVDLQAKTAAWTPLYYGNAQVRTHDLASVCGCVL